jgi:tRNA threonylcarbamoyl adenosine modification protein YjeE
VLRSGGQPGDLLFATGTLGGSLAGHHLDFVPRLAEARWLVSHARPTAMMDLSDGIAADLPRLAAASKCSYALDEAAVPKTRGCSLEQALNDGEDYELLFAMPPRLAKRLAGQWRERFPKVPLSHIGQLLPLKPFAVPKPVMASITSHSPAETFAFARQLAAELRSGDVLALLGDLGAGKTHFVKGLAAGLLHTGEVTSPTFTLIHEYTGGTLPLYHFDFYRLESEDETLAIGLDDYLAGEGVLAIEWADKFPRCFLQPRAGSASAQVLRTSAESKKWRARMISPPPRTAAR